MSDDAMAKDGNDLVCGETIQEDKREDEPPRKRFKIESEEDRNKWELPREMLDYVKENFENYIKEKDVKETILTDNPRPRNIKPVRKLDTYLNDLLKDKRKNIELTFDTKLEKVQNKTNDIMGPLAKLWQSVDRYNAYQNDPDKEEKEEPPQLDIVEALALLEQTVLLVGQCHNSISYERRKNVLGALMSSTQVSTMLKEKADLLKENDGSLFGKDFRDHVIETCKAKKKSLEAFSTKKQPFRSGPSYQGQHRGGRFNSSQSNNRGGYGGSGYGGRSYFKGQGGQTKKPYNGKCFTTRDRTQLQQSNRVSTASEPRESKSCSPVCKTNFCKTKSPFRAIGRKTKIFSPILGNDNSGQECSVDSGRFQDSTCFRTYSGKNSSSSKNECRTKQLNRVGNSTNVAKGGYLFSSERKRTIATYF